MKIRNIIPALVNVFRTPEEHVAVLPAVATTPSPEVQTAEVAGIVHVGGQMARFGAAMAHRRRCRRGRKAERLQYDN